MDNFNNKAPSSSPEELRKGPEAGQERPTPPPVYFDPNIPPPVHFDPNILPPVHFDPNILPPVHFDPNIPPPVHFDPTIPPPVHFDPTIPPPVHFDPTIPPPVHFDPTIPPPVHFDPTILPPVHFDLATPGMATVGQSCPAPGVRPSEMTSSHPRQLTNPYPVNQIHRNSPSASGQDQCCQTVSIRGGTQHPPESLPHWQGCSPSGAQLHPPRLVIPAAFTPQGLPVQGPGYIIHPDTFMTDMHWIWSPKTGLVSSVVMPVYLPYTHHLSSSRQQGSGLESHPWMTGQQAHQDPLFSILSPNLLQLIYPNQVSIYKQIHVGLTCTKEPPTQSGQQQNLGLGSTSVDPGSARNAEINLNDVQRRRLPSVAWDTLPSSPVQPPASAVVEQYDPPFSSGEAERPDSPLRVGSNLHAFFSFLGSHADLSPGRRPGAAQQLSRDLCSASAEQLARPRGTVQQAVCCLSVALPSPDNTTDDRVLGSARAGQQGEGDQLTEERSGSLRGVQVRLDTLPELAVLTILSFLPLPDLLRVRQTCTYLHAMSHAPSLWTSVTIRDLNRFRMKPMLCSQLLMQDCYTAGREEWDQEENEDDTASPEATRKHVKDYIRTLTVRDGPQPSAFTYTYNGHKRKCQKEVENSGIFSSDSPVCPRLETLNVTCLVLTPTVITTVQKHPWLTRLSLRVLPSCSGLFSQLLEDQLVACYTAFQVLTRLTSFEFVFPNSAKFNNNLVGNVLFFYSQALHTEMSQFIQAAPGLRHIVMTDVTDGVLRTILGHCRGLQSLAIGSHLLTFRGFQCDEPLSTLKSLTISATFSNLNAALAAEIARALPGLRVVNMTDMPGTSEGVAALLNKCRHLDTVHLDRHVEQGLPRNNASIFHQPSSLSPCWAGNRTPLRELSIRTELSDDFVHKLCERNPTLTSLSLTDSEDITDASLATLAELCPHLTRLSVRQRHSYLSARGVLRLIQKRPGLVSLEVQSHSNKGRFVPLAGGPGEECSHLAQHLKQGGPWWDDSTPPGTESSAPLSQAKRPPTCQRSKMRTVRLGRVPQMTWEDMAVLAWACPHLQELELTGALGLGDDAVAALVRGCPDLRSLTLDRQMRGVTYTPCHVTDRALQLLTRHATRLQHLRALYCYELTAPALAALLVEARSLRSVTVTHDDHLHGLRNFTAVDKHVQQLLKASRPPLTMQVEVGTSRQQERWRTSLLTMTVVRKGPQASSPTPRAWAPDSRAGRRSKPRVSRKGQRDTGTPCGVAV